MIRALLTVATAVCVSAASGVSNVGARPAAPIRVVLLLGESVSSERAWPAAEEKFLEELALLPLSVESAAAAATGEAVGSESTLLSETTALHNARVGVSILRGATDPERVEVRLYELDSETDVIKTWRVDEAGNPDAALIVGIRAAEAVRAALRSEPAQATDPAAPPSSIDTVNATADSQPVDSRTAEANAAEESDFRAISPRTPSPVSRIGVGAGFGMGTSFENAGVCGGIVFASDWRPFRYAGLVLDAVYLPWGPDVSAGGVTSRLDLVLFRAQVEARFRDGKRVRPAVGVGGGGLLVIAEGIQSDGRRLTKDLTKVGYVGGSVSVSVKVSSWMRLETAAGLGASLPAVTLRHGEVVAARLGRPLFDLSVRAMFGTN